MTDITDADYDRHWDLLWNTQLGVRYHMHLQNYYTRIGKFITAFTLLMSSAAFAVVYQSNSELSKWLMCIAAMLQVAELVIDTKSNATLHASLRQRYLQLELALAGKTYVLEEEEKSFKQTRTQIEIDEPPVIKSLMDRCHNELCIVHGIENHHQQKWYENFAAWWRS
ncbi:hypothetical protein [Vibrio campbellii]|uniref:hypothetical protein n=1 Tax=Vibrio campbellii TaxID=680 RepID=UPI001F2FD2CF|nr:hypothetical protein [Vibrio campbellii]MCE7729248.1 hypothetical protein [Vibrio campbellii]